MLEQTNGWSCHPPVTRSSKQILGEIPRLRDDESGYGPRGKGFITHVDIPNEIEQAFQALITHFNDEAPALSRRIG